MKFCVYFKLRTKACITYLLNCVKYLGIHVCKDPMEQQLLNFSSKLHKTKSILNMWLQRHRSIIPSFDEKMIIFGSFSHNSKFNIINLFILLGKFHIHKVKMSKATPSFPLFLIELKIYFESLLYVESNKKWISNWILFKLHSVKLSAILTCPMYPLSCLGMSVALFLFFWGGVLSLFHLFILFDDKWS